MADRGASAQKASTSSYFSSPPLSRTSTQWIAVVGDNDDDDDDDGDGDGDIRLFKTTPLLHKF